MRRIEALCPVWREGCLPVVGDTRALVCDTVRERAVEVPRPLIRLLEAHAGQPLTVLLEASCHPEVTRRAVAKLIAEDLLRLTRWPGRYPPMLREDIAASPLKGAILERDAGSTWDLMAAVDELAALRCRHVLLRSLAPDALSELAAVLRRIGEGFPLTVSARLGGPVDEAALIEVSENSPRLVSLVAHRAARSGVLHAGQAGLGRVSLRRGPLRLGRPVLAHPRGFTVSVEPVCESGSRHPFFNRTLTLSADGALRNGPANPEAFGRVGERALAELVEDPDFRHLWGVSRDQISDCRRCEHRAICPSGRPLARGPDGLYVPDRPCPYDPRTGRWTPPVV